MNQIIQWHTQRAVDFCPKHFIETKTPITDESYFWIVENLIGRFCLKRESFGLRLNFEDTTYPCFEDPKEAILYELTWS